MEESVTKLKSLAKEFPGSPGVYLFKDESGKVLYVGKAKNLKNRILQYFGHDTRPQIPFLLEEARSLDYTVASNELESLFLENTLIKQYMPAYNIMLRDDKNYAFIKIDFTSEIPTIGYARKIEGAGDKAKYFGPYSSAKKIKDTLDLVRKIFSFCGNSTIGKRPCFYYFLHRCPGVCAGQMTLEEYRVHLERIIDFLSGKTDAVVKDIKKWMQYAATKRQFERAARLRDQLKALSVLQERQLALFPAKVNWDFISHYGEAGSICINLFKVREGKLIDKENFIYHLPLAGNVDTESAESLQRFAETYYTDTTDVPREIYTSLPLPDSGLINTVLETKVKRKTVIEVPTRGQKAKLISLSTTNAREYLKKWQRDQAGNKDVILKALEDLKTLLKLPTIPHRIEGYDISNTQGTNPVSSMVVMNDGQPAKGEYRKFKIRVKDTPDDFAMMKETLTRRLKHILPLEGEEKETWPRPDLIVIDGGKGQLGMAVEVLAEYNLKIPVIGLAKRIEEIFLPHNSTPIVLDHSQPALQMLQRLRDEAHRFGITFHRQLRSKQAVKSQLDEIHGIGPKTKKLLKQKFGTISQIRATSLDELAAVIGKSKAEIVKKEL